jgi:hypothetical protein
VDLPHGDDCSPEGAKSSAVFQLLVQKGLQDTKGSFVWDKTPSSVTVNEEVKNFEYNEKMLKKNIN